MFKAKEHVRITFHFFQYRGLITPHSFSSNESWLVLHYILPQPLWWYQESKSSATIVKLFWVNWKVKTVFSSVNFEKWNHLNFSGLYFFLLALPLLNIPMLWLNWRHHHYRSWSYGQLITRELYPCLLFLSVAFKL